MKKYWLLYLLVFLFIFTACSDDDPVSPLPETNIEGIFILNEGSYGKDNASLSVYNFNTKKVTQNVYKTANGRNLGNTGQSMMILGDEALINVYASKTITVVNLSNYKEKYSLDFLGELQPRYSVAKDANIIYTTAYKSNGEGYVLKIDLKSKSIKKRIPMGKNPEKLVIANNKLYVAIGGWGSERIISVIDLDKDEKIKDIKVGYNTGNIISFNNYVFAISTGGWASGQKITGLYKINSSTDTVVDSLKDNITSPGLMVVFENKLLAATSAGVVQIDPQNLAVEKTLIAKNKVIGNTNGWIYGLTYDRKTERIYCGNAKDFKQNGDVAVFDKNGKFIERINCGINPNTIIVSKK